MEKADSNTEVPSSIISALISPGFNKSKPEIFDLIYPHYRVRSIPNLSVVALRWGLKADFQMMSSSPLRYGENYLR